MAEEAQRMSYRVQCRMKDSNEFQQASVRFETYDAASAWAQDVLEEGIGVVTGYLIEEAAGPDREPAWRKVVQVEINR